MILQVDHIEKSFGEKQVLKDVTFAAEGGQAFGLLGRNGAGKTTTIRIIMDVFAPDHGKILLDHEPIRYGEVSFGYLPEERGLYPKKKIFDQLVYFAQLKGMEKTAAGRSVDAWLERLEMSEYRDKKLDTLSKGNQQKIQLITALAHDPQIVILDEPFSGLDPVNAMLLKGVVKETIAKGKIVLFSSHQMNYIEEFCDGIAIINGGKVVLTGGLNEIRRAYPRNRLVIRSEANAQILQAFGKDAAYGEDGEVILTLPEPEAKNAVMQKLTQEYDIDEIRVAEPSLNDIFVEYTREQI